MEPQYKCETCKDTGFYGDNGPGITGNREYQACDQCPKVPLQKKNNMEHTPGPAIQDNEFVYTKSTTGDGDIIAICDCGSGKDYNEDLANAEFIVRAYNNHNELVEACNLILDRMELGRVASRGVNRVKSYEIKQKRGEDIREIIKIFKQAIAKAERKEVKP